MPEVCAASVAPHNLRAAEVHEDDPSADFAHHVLRFDVAVQKPGAVQRRERSAEIDADARDLTGAHRTAVANHARERLALDVLHPDSGFVAVAIGAVHDHDVRMPHSGEMAAFFERRRRNPIPLREQLDGDIAVERGVPAAIHRAERAGSNGFKQDDVAPVTHARVVLLASGGSCDRAVGSVRIDDGAPAAAFP